MKILGTTIRSLDDLADISATSMNDSSGTYWIDVSAERPLAKYGFRSSNVVLEIDGRKVVIRNFEKIFQHLHKGSHQAKVWRGQKLHQFKFNLE